MTRRCAQRQFLLRPDAETNNAFLYCLILAATRFEIDILITCAMSNHHHTVIFDRHGRYPAFLECFHKLLARSQNALRGRRENCWASEQASVVLLLGGEAVLEKLVYTATNPVKDHLVERVRHWPGVNTLGALLNGRSVQARRPRHFFRRDGNLPESVELRFRIPPEVGSEAEMLTSLRMQVSSVEDELAAARMSEGRRVLGRRGVLAQSWRSCAVSVEPRRRLRPAYASMDHARRDEAVAHRQAFLSEYARARAAWLRGEAASFPSGTYWLRRFANVPIESEVRREAA